MATIIRRCLKCNSTDIDILYRLHLPANRDWSIQELEDAFLESEETLDCYCRGCNTSHFGYHAEHVEEKRADQTS